jgi:AraC family transcriptional regulator
MTLQPFFDHNLRAAEARAEPVCVLLDGGQERFHVPRGALTTVLIALGSCTVQRLIEGEWLDVRALYRGGILLAELAGPIRLSGASVIEAAALFVPKPLMERTLGRINDKLSPHVSVELPSDTVVISLLRALMASRRDVAAPHIEAPVLDAILLRLAILADQGDASTSSDASPLPAWRLRRVSAMVKERLDATVTLSDMAEAAGLSPMHFAAQFKKATGMRPHHYLVAQRIEQAKLLLRDNKHSLYDVALTVGFRTQAHFCTVFKQHEHTTPARWRRERLAA